MKKIFTLIGVVCVSALMLFVGLNIVMGIDGIKIGSFDWFPSEEEIATGRFFWILYTGLMIIVEIILTFIEVKLVKKFKMAF